jgi:putative membrane protein
MENALKHFNSENRERIAQRISTLEAHTDAEVVCAVATESGRYDRGESLCGLFVALFALISGNKIAAMSGWDAQDSVSVGMQVILLVGGFVTGSLLASYWHGLRRLFVSRAEMEAEVRGKTHQVFSQQGIGGTRHRGGLLIYLSLFEHRLEIRCDQTIAEQIPEADLEAIRDEILTLVRAGKITEGLLAGLDPAEKSLAKHVPATDLATESLPNQLLVFHPRP